MTQLVRYDTFEEILNKESEKILNFIEKLLKIDSCTTLEDMSTFINSNNTTLKKYTKSVKVIEKAITNLRNSCLKELETIYLLLSPIGVSSSDDLKYRESYKNILDSIHFMSQDEIKQIELRLFKNFIFRNFIHQSRVCLGLILPKSIETNFIKQLSSSTLLRENEFYLGKLKIHKEQTFRFIRQLKVISHLKNKNLFEISLIPLNDVISYLEDYKEINTPYVYYKNSSVIEFEFIYSELFYFKSDLFKIQEIIDVILDNACEELTLAQTDSTYLKAPKIIVTLRKEDSNIILEFLDNGRGIKDEEHLFTYNKSTKFSFGGSGIGLYAAREIILNLNGSIEVTTSVNGTCFLVKLPILD